MKTSQTVQVLILLITLSTIPIATFAQEVDSIWFNKKWEKASLPGERYYLRTIRPVIGKGDDLFEVTDYHPNGKAQMTGYFTSLVSEIREGEFKYYSEDGILTMKNVWVNNIVAETFQYDASGKQTLHVIKSDYLATLTSEQKSEKYGIKQPDKQPEFPGGADSFSKFLTDNIVYPSQAVQNKVQGRVIIAATISKSGKLKQLRVVQSSNPILEEEALRVAKLMPEKKWAPAQDGGKKIEADFTFPVLFKLD